MTRPKSDFIFPNFFNFIEIASNALAENRQAACTVVTQLTLLFSSSNIPENAFHFRRP